MSQAASHPPSTAFSLDSPVRRWLRGCLRGCLGSAGLAALVLLHPFSAGATGTGNSVAFESGQVRPLALSPSGDRLYAANTPDGRVEIYSVTTGGLVHLGSVPVGLEPVALALRGSNELWVVNHLSDSVSVVDVGSQPAKVIRTLLVGDEPRDIVFAGPARERAFITTAHRGQNSPWNDPENPGQLTTPGIGRADVWVFDAANLGADPGGNALSVLSLFTDTPRALAVSTDGATVYAAGFHTGNRTTVVPEGAVCDGGSTASACSVDSLGGAPGGLPAPNVDANNIKGPETGLIVRFDGSHWLDQLSRIWDPVIRYSLPDRDVFAIDAMATPPQQVQSWSGVGTILYNMAVNPVSGKVYVANTEARNERRLEGPRAQGSTVATVQGRLHQSQITVLDGSSVQPRHLNKHIDYDLRPAPPGVAERSLAQPQQMVISSDGRTLYLAAFGSGKIGIFDTASLEDNSFTPSASSHISLSGGGPSGLVLDESRERLYTLTRFDNSVRVIDLASLAETQTLAMRNPEPAEIVTGRRLLYDARFSSSNGEASCGSCHVFGDFDSLAWDLGNPVDVRLPNPSPVRNSGVQANFHPLKGPMTTQSLRGMANHGAMHWRGDRTGGNDEPNAQPDSGTFNEHLGFTKFSGAFVGLLGRTAEPTAAEMSAFADFALRLSYPPNPIRRLDNSLTTKQQAGHDFYFGPVSDDVGNCNSCHVLDPAAGFFGSDGFSANDGLPQTFKIAHLRNLYQKAGMFGGVTVRFLKSTDTAPAGDQVRGFGYQHDGAVDSPFRFLHGRVFTFPDESKQREVEQFLFAYDSNLAPVVGQQITATPDTLASAAGRIGLLESRAAAGECEVVAKAVIDGRSRGYLRLASGSYASDVASEALLTAAELRILVSTSGAALTYSCVPVGSGRRIGIDGDCDLLLDGDDPDPDVSSSGGSCGVSGVVAAPVFALSANPASITTGATSTLTWSAASNATSCTAIEGWTANPGIAGGSQTVTPGETTSYTLVCSGSGGSSSRSATITVTPPQAAKPVVSLSASPASLKTGQSSTLSWSSAEAASCTATGAWTGTRATVGTETVVPTTAGSQVYTLTCTGAGGSTSASATLNVTAAKPVVTLSASPAAITTGQSSTLSWSATNAASCAASGTWTGAKPASGSEIITPASAGTYSYTLTCTGPGGSGAKTTSLTVSAPKPTVTIKFKPAKITTDQSATLTWSSTNASSCTASNAWTGPRALSGNLVVRQATPGSFTYALTCTGTGGSVTGSAKLTVSAGLPTLQISISPAIVWVNETATLNWTSTIATSCIASGAWSGTQAVNGSVTVHQATPGSYSYTLNCTAATGSVQRTATLQVEAAAPVVSLAVSPTSIEHGQQAQLIWSSTGAAACLASGGWSGPRTVSGDETVQPEVIGEQVYTLSCTGPGGSHTASASLTVVEPPPPVPTLTLSLSPEQILTGEQATLSWSATGVTACTASDNWSGDKPGMGTEVLAPVEAGTYGYTLSCSGAGGTISESRSLLVSDPPSGERSRAR